MRSGIIEALRTLRWSSGGAEDDSALAARLNMSLNTFLQNFNRARQFLAQCLKKAGVDLDGERSS